MYWRSQISKIDEQNTATEIEAQNLKDESSMIFLPNGYLYSVNNEFKKIFQKNEHEFEDTKFYKLFEPFNKSRESEMSKLTSGK